MAIASAMLPAWIRPGPAGDERDAITAVPGRAFAAAQTAGAAFGKRTVVAGKDDDRIIGEVVTLYCIQHLADAPVQFLHNVAIGAGPGSPCKGR